MRRLVVLSLLVLAGCTEPIKQVSSGNESFRVELMAVVDGCNVYRGNSDVYFVICPSGAATANHEWQTGKVHHEIQSATVVRP